MPFDIKTIRSHRFSTLLLAGCLLVGIGSGCATFRQRTLNSHLSAEQLIQEAAHLRQSGQDERAEQLLLKSLQFDADNAATHCQLADLYVRQGETEKGIRQMRQAIEAGCNSPQIHARLGELYLTTGHLLAAKRQAELAVGLSSLSPEAWELAGDVARAESRWSDAMAAYHRVLPMAVNRPGIELKIAEVYHQTGRPLRALSTLEQMLSEQPANLVSQQALILHGVLLTEVKNYPLAIDQLKRAVARGDALPETYVRLSNAQWLSGQVESSRKTLLAGGDAFPEQTVFNDLLDRSNEASQPLLTNADNSYR